jgi:uncharacterized protein YciW
MDEMDKICVIHFGGPAESGLRVRADRRRLIHRLEQATNYVRLMTAGDYEVSINPHAVTYVSDE